MVHLKKGTHTFLAVFRNCFYTWQGHIRVREGALIPSPVNLLKNTSSLQSAKK